jgi:hypothetical protein
MRAKIGSLQRSDLDLHGARAEHAESVWIVATFEGETVWNGVVEVFTLPERAAGKEYAWRHEAIAAAAAAAISARSDGTSLVRRGRPSRVSLPPGWCS